MFQQPVRKRCVLDPLGSPSSLGELALENEKLMPMIIRCDVGRYGANFSRQKTAFRSSVILVVLFTWALASFMGRNFFHSSGPFLLSPKEVF